MAGFIRRFSSMPSNAVLTAIEGINIIDVAPPSSPQGINENVVALVGEFADMSYALAVDSAGVVTTSPRPVEIFSGQDLLNKVGGFDSTLGQFGSACGNGYVELRNKTFGRLVVVPVNLASGFGARFWRELPTNTSATDATPVVPVQGALVAAGTMFRKSGVLASQIKNATALTFSNATAYTSGTDGTVVVAAAAATQDFNSATGAFTTFSRLDGKTGVEVGDIIVVGVVSSAGAQGDDAGTYRVVSVTSATKIAVQKLNAVNFAWATASAVLVWRLHTGAVADSFGSGSGSLTSAQGSYSAPVRPLTDSAGVANVDGVWAVATALAPAVTPASITATSADPLSGLAGLVGPTSPVAYTVLVQRANAVNDATIDALYTSAFASLLNDDETASAVAHVWAARKSDTIRSTTKAHVLAASQNGLGRSCSVSPKLDLTKSSAISTVVGAAAPGVGATRDERVFYDWPAVMTYVPEALGVSITGADGLVYTDGMVDVTGDGWMSAIMGNLAPERNPGEATPTTLGTLAPVLGYARNTPNLDLPTWELLRSRGIAGIRMDRTVGPVFQSGITSSLEAGRKNIARRKMTDYIEDSLAQQIKPFVKLPMSEQFKDGVLSQIQDFLEVLLSSNNSSAQRITSFSIDPDGGNTPASESLGIYVVIVKVRTLASADFIVLQVEAGEGVVTTSEVS